MNSVSCNYCLNEEKKLIISQNGIITSNKNNTENL